MARPKLRTPSTRRPARALRCGLGLAVALTSAVGGACGTDGAGGESGSGDPVRDTLEQLGVDTTATDRLGDDGSPLPAEYTPLGTTAAFNKTDELFVVGIAPRGLPSPTGGPDQQAARSTAYIDAELGNARLLDRDPAPGAEQPVWVTDTTSSQGFARSTRAAAAADIDGDGRDETVIAYVDRADSAHDREIAVQINDDAEATQPFASRTTVLAIQDGVEDIAVVAGDFDGDGADDLVIAAATANAAHLFFVVNRGGNLAVDSAANLTLAPRTADAQVAVRLAAGNLDDDPAEELALVLNEYVWQVDGGLASYRVYDDARSGRSQLAEGAVQAFDGSLYSAVVADLAIGDIDGDNRGELVFGGLDGYHNSCESYGYLAMALDDARSGFAQLGDRRFEEFLSDCPSYAPWRLRFAHVNTVDLDGDRVDEVHINQFVFASWKQEAPWTEIARLPQSVLVDSGDFGWIDRSTTQMVAADVTGDARGDIVVYSQDRARIAVWGDDAINGFGQLAAIETDFANSQRPTHALLVPVNVDTDSLVLRYSEASYQLVFTEPVVLAALAAAPCQEGIGQNLEACYTTFGTATSATVTREQVLSVSASASVGVNIDGGALTQSEFEMKATVSATASAINSEAYTLERSVVYTSGPLEDTVIFATIPYDQYTYTVLSHPDPAMIGQEVVVSLPRDPITLMVEREFFNQTVPEGSVRIDAEIFQHLPGDLASYPTRADKNQLLSRYGGLATESQSVGQGNNAVEIGLAVGEEYTAGGSLELGFEFSVEATGGTVLGGFSVGASVENTLTVTSGSQTSYTGSIGSLDAEHFADAQYSYGLFTYVYPDPITGQQFEVVNYWVE